MSLFEKLKIASSTELKEWLVTTMKEGLLQLTNAVKDIEFNRNTTYDKWMRFHRRMKVIVYSLMEEAQNLPSIPLSFLSKLTVGQLRIPHKFLLDFEDYQLRGAITQDRRLLLPQEMIEIKDDETLV